MHSLWKRTAATLLSFVLAFNMIIPSVAATSEMSEFQPAISQSEQQNEPTSEPQESTQPTEQPTPNEEQPELTVPDKESAPMQELVPSEEVLPGQPSAPSEQPAESESQIPEEPTEEVPEEEFAKAEKNNLAQGKTYTTTANTVWENNGKQYPDHGGMLTDGVIHTDDASFATGEDLVGYKVDSEQHQEFVVDLGGLHEVNGYAIHGWSSNDTNDYIWNLRHYTVSYLDEAGNWNVLEDKTDRLPYEADTPACYTWEGSCNPVIASKIKFSVQCWSVGMFLSELEVFGTEKPQQDTYGNKALNCTYTKSEPYKENDQVLYPDVGDKEFTDGVLGKADYKDEAWVGFAGNEAEKFIQVDLGGLYEIDKTEVHYNVDANVGIMKPVSLKVSYSLNGTDFYDFGTFQDLSDQNGAHTATLTAGPVKARYIRFDFEKVGWLFVSEVAAYGTKTELDPKVPYLAQNLAAKHQAHIGGNVELAVVPVLGTQGTVRYQWTKDGVSLDEKSNKLVLNNVQQDAAGVYQVTVVNELDGQEYTAQSRACEVTVSEIKDAATLLEVFRNKVPKIEDGRIVIDESNTSLYKVVLAGSDREAVIDQQGNVYEPLVDTTVNLVYKAVSTTDPEDSKIADYNVQLVVPGRYQKEEGDNKAPATLPSMREWKGGNGSYQLTETSAIVANTEIEKKTADKMVVFFKDVLKRDISVREGTAGKGDIQLKLDSSIPEMGAEGYWLEVGDSVIIRAPQQTGLLYGAVTTVQALYADKQKSTIPQGIARDYPAYKVRGAFLDIARMAYPIDYLEEITKYLTWFKMNEFHLHLNDKGSQDYKSFRLESDLKNLTSTDLYYTKAEYKAFQDMAADWGVSIISEIETPGHARAFRDVPGIKMTEDGEHLDISDAQTVETIKKLFDEMLDGEDPVIRNSVVHIGTDEYYAGTSEQLNEYAYDLTQHLAKKGVTMRFWGAFLNNAGVPEGVDKTIPGSQCNIWASSGEWDNTLSPQQMMDYGYDLINSNGYNLYIVPGGQEYTDSLNHAALFNNWDVNHFDQAGKTTNILPLGHPQILGANFLIWNDRGTANTGFSIFDTFTRFQNGTTIVAEKTWHGPADEDQTYTDFAKRDKMFKTFVGGANPTRRLDSNTQELVKLDFEDVENDIVLDQTENHLNGTITNGKIVEQNGSSVLSLDGKGSLALPVNTIGFPYEVSFDLKLTQEAKANTVLFASEDGTFYLNIDETGKVGFKRDGFKVIQPDKDVRFDRAEGYTFIFDYKMPINEWTTLKFSSDQQFSYLEVNGTKYKAKCTVEKLWGKPDRPLDESSISMFPTEKMFAGITGMVDNITIRDPTIKAAGPNANLAFECEVTTSPLEDGSMYGRNFYPGALTDGIRNDVNTRVSFDPSSETTWATVDLGKICDLNLIKLYFFESCPEYRISISEDGTHWKELLHKTNGVQGRPSGTDVEVALTFDTQKAKYIKYEGLKKWQSQWGTYHGGLSELEAYNMRESRSITVEKSQNGKVIASQTTAQQGDTITLKAKPESGYQVKTVLVNNEALQPENGVYRFVMPDTDVIVKAEFEKILASVVTVNFNLQGHGAAIEPVYTEKGTMITAPAEPTAEGWSFGGWFRDAACTTPWNFGKDTVKAEITLYAKWTEKKQDQTPDNPNSDSEQQKPNHLDEGGNKGDSSKPNTANGAQKTPSNSPKTGDNGYMVCFVMAMLICVSAALYVFLKKKDGKQSKR